MKFVVKVKRMPGIPSVGPTTVASTSRPLSRPGIQTRRALCASCDIACSVVTEVQSGRVTRVRSSDNPLFRDNICVKGIVAPKILPTLIASCSR